MHEPVLFILGLIIRTCLPGFNCDLSINFLLCIVIEMSAHDEPCFLFPPTFPETVLEPGVCISGMKVMVVLSMIRRRQAVRIQLSMSRIATAMLKTEVLSRFRDSL